MDGSVKKRGRPKGAKGKRTLAVEAFTSAVYGGSAVTQSAAFCMVTRAELVQAGGNMALARIRKAKALQMLGRQEGVDLPFALAMKLLSDELDALKPYTDRKMPVAVDLEVSAPSVVVMAMEGAPTHQVVQTFESDTDFIDVLPLVGEQVAHLKSHDTDQSPVFPGFEALGPAD